MNGKFLFNKLLHTVNILPGDEISPTDAMLFLKIYSRNKSAWMVALSQLHMNELHCSCFDSFIHLCIMGFQLS